MPTFKSYLTGFLLSLLLTGLVFLLVQTGAISGNTLTVVVILLALIQASIQLVFFLHLNDSSGWHKGIFVSTLGLMLILVIGSLWIMKHLNYNMTPGQMNDYMMHTENIFK